MSLNLSRDDLDSIVYGYHSEYELVEILPTVDDLYLGTTPFVFKDSSGNLYGDYITYDGNGRKVYGSIYDSHPISKLAKEKTKFCDVYIDEDGNDFSKI